MLFRGVGKLTSGVVLAMAGLGFLGGSLSDGLVLFFWASRAICSFCKGSGFEESGPGYARRGSPAQKVAVAVALDGFSSTMSRSARGGELEEGGAGSIR